MKHTNQTIEEVLDFLQKAAPDQALRKQIKGVRKTFLPKNAWAKLLEKLFTETNPHCREKLIENLIINWVFLGETKREQFFQKEEFKAPWVIVISPWMNCNLFCQGCYAGEYDKKNGLDRKIVDRVIKEGKGMGIYFYVISGGEPFIRSELLDLCQKHYDCYFLVYTNGTLINLELAKKIARLGNIAPAISVEGLEKETDQRRGQGTWQKIMRAMANLKREGVIFGFSATATRKNSSLLASEQFINYFIKKGCSFGWYFQYIPIGRDPNTRLMSTPEQRNQLRKFVHHEVRNRKPIFIADFWNDGPLVGGCMAGGRLYLHINVNGDVEPCVFAHFAVDNIKRKSLTSVLRSSFFRKIRQRIQSVESSQRYSDNLLTPCMIIDNPWVLRKIIKGSKAYPTHHDSELIVEDLKITSHLDQYASNLHQLVDPVWKKEY